MLQHCCSDMIRALTFDCRKHGNEFDCPDTLLCHVAKFDEYGIIVHDGGMSFVLISHCPWCGKQLPDSKRDRWFKELEAQGVADPDDENVPKVYKSDAWFRN